MVWKCIETRTMTNAIYKVIATGTVKNLYTLTQLFNSPLSHEDGDYNYILLKLEKIEDNANKRKITNVNKEELLLQWKSKLPQDMYTTQAISDHKRAHEYLVTLDLNNC